MLTEIIYSIDFSNREFGTPVLGLSTNNLLKGLCHYSDLHIRDNLISDPTEHFSKLISVTLEDL